MAEQLTELQMNTYRRFTDQILEGQLDRIYGAIADLEVRRVAIESILADRALQCAEVIEVPHV